MGIENGELGNQSKELGSEEGKEKINLEDFFGKQKRELKALE